MLKKTSFGGALECGNPYALLLNFSSATRAAAVNPQTEILACSLQQTTSQQPSEQM